MTNAEIRGVCPVCNRSISLLKDGRMGRHASKLRTKRPAQMCSGWGQMSRGAVVSASKARITIEAKSLREDRDELFYKLVRLLTYMHNLQQDYPDVQFPDLPDQYSENMWRYAV